LPWRTKAVSNGYMCMALAIGAYEGTGRDGGEDVESDVAAAGSGRQ
jgi:hypothetical protein